MYLQYTLWFFEATWFNKSQFKWLCDVFLLVVFMVALFGVYQYYIGVEIPTAWTDSKVETSITTRVFSVIGSPNVLGSLLVLAIPMSLASFLASRGALKKLVYGGFFLVMLACMVLRFPRGLAGFGPYGADFGVVAGPAYHLGLIIVALLTPMACSFMTGWPI